MVEGSLPWLCHKCRVLIIAKQPIKNTLGWMILHIMSEMRMKEGWETDRSLTLPKAGRAS